jgi:hypothetical protein
MGMAERMVKSGQLGHSVASGSSPSYCAGSSSSRGPGFGLAQAGKIRGYLGAAQ